jgi:hypothetical protein
MHYDFPEFISLENLQVEQLDGLVQARLFWLNVPWFTGVPALEECPPWC